MDSFRQGERDSVRGIEVFGEEIESAVPISTVEGGGGKPGPKR